MKKELYVVIYRDALQDQRRVTYSFHHMIIKHQEFWREGTANSSTICPSVSLRNFKRSVEAYLFRNTKLRHF